jgi:hypothetical protein
MWTNESVDAAMVEFAAAIASDRERPFVRGMQVSALLNRRSPDARVELVKVAADMRRNAERIDGRVLREIRAIYHAALNDPPFTERLIAVVPGAEQLAIVEMVRADSSPAAGSDDSLNVMKAPLEEAGGRPADAAQTWRAVRANQAEASSPLARRADAAIKGLAK